MSLPVTSVESSTSPSNVFIITPDAKLLQQYLRNIEIATEEISTVKFVKREELTDISTTQKSTQKEIATTTTNILTTTSEDDDDDDDYVEPEKIDGLKSHCIATLCSG